MNIMHHNLGQTNLPSTDT